MKAILVGLGEAGFGWYKRLRSKGLLLAVVERDPARKEKLGDDPVPFYTSLEEALSGERPDFVVNVTPPAAHTAVNNAAFDWGLPVLCEKPIWFNYAESLEIVARAEREGIPFMIAENYRHFPYIRKLKALLEEDVIGGISSVDIAFRRYHRVKRDYAVSVLDDIGVHHLDLLRYLTGREGVAVQAGMFNPSGGWREEGAVLQTMAIIELEGGIPVHYSATIASRGPMTPWCGVWRIEGTKGAILLDNGSIAVHLDDGYRTVTEYSDMPQSDSLDEFLASLAEGREAETSASDYLQTQALVHYTNMAAKSGTRTTIELRAKEGMRHAER
ncbi:Gfo/Idh/MocA family protein [Bacillus sp. FJAT-28004]|uniref:Gfo/Idh/MocA family protein n=1 Tax=Bacillus sp. FJAT-28004 TaxID=1679165 RepID=UPI0006B5ECF5|nr:Gfo/Idh/MocA family oxidoreductase [Bacillus sp. FJAT-28004]